MAKPMLQLQITSSRKSSHACTLLSSDSFGVLRVVVVIATSANVMHESWDEPELDMCVRAPTVLALEVTAVYFGRNRIAGM